MSIQYSENDVRIAITDDGRGSTEPGTGHGIAGMRERARLLGGELRAGPAPDYGWSVHARLPLHIASGVA